MEQKRNVSSQITRDLLILLGIVALALALRAFHLGAQSLWYDEGYSVYLAGKNLAQITAETANDIQPPLYYYLLHVWMALFGKSEAALRSLSLLFGLLSLPLFYLLGKRLFSPGVGLLAAGLAAISPLYLWYSQEVRMYTLLVTLTLCSCYLLWLALEDANTVSRRWKWIGVAVTLILALYTHYFAVFILVFQVVYVFIGWQLGWHRFRPGEGLVSLLAVLLAYVPWLPALFGRYEGDVSYWEGRLKLDEAIRKIGISFSAGESVLEGTGQWLALGFVFVAFICLLAVVLLWKEKGEEGTSVAPHNSRWARVVFLLLYLSLPIALLLFTTYWTPKFNPRYAMIASPPLFILLAGGLVALSRARWVWMRGVALIMVLFIVGTTAYANLNTFFDIRFTKPDFRGAVQWVEEHQQEDEAVILTSGHAYPVFGYYYSGDNWYPLPEERTLSTTNTLDYGVAQDLNRLLSGKRGVWLVLWQNEVVDPNGYLTMLLDQYAEPQPVEGSFYHVRLRHYTLPPNVHFPEEPEIAHQMTVNLGNELTLLGYSPALTQTVYLYWQARQPLTEDYKISLRLKDLDGFDWSRRDSDRRLASLLYPTMRWQPDELVVGHYEIPALPGTPPGTYDLEAIVYAKGAPQALDVLNEQGTPVGKTIQLGPVTLSEPWPASREELEAGESPPTVWEDEIALLGYLQDRLDAQAGDEVHLTLFWETLDAISTDYALRLSWVQNGKRLADQVYALTGRSYPTSDWKVGDLLRGQYSLDVPPDIAPGTADIEVGLFNEPEAVSPPSHEWFPLTSLNIEQTDRVFETPEMQIPIKANFENKMSLLGANLSSTEVGPGDALDLTLYWKGTDRMKLSYTVFVHLLDEEHHIQAQEDRVPAAGNRPTTGWVSGEVIDDVYHLTINPEAEPGEYLLEVGVYDANDPAFPRLGLVDEHGEPKENRVIVTHVKVEG